MSGFLDSIVPFFVGNRTQIVAAFSFIVNALSIFGVIPPGVTDKLNQVAAPLGASFLAAKIDRVARR